jgi:putative transposase
MRRVMHDYGWHAGLHPVPKTPSDRTFVALSPNRKWIADFTYVWTAEDTSNQFQRLLADHGVVCSISRPGKAWDNAAMERLFSSLKTERTARKTCQTGEDAKADAFDYIEVFYNAKRRHSTIGSMSPMESERQAGLA